MAIGKFNVQGIQSPQDAQRVNQVLHEVFGIRDVDLKQQSGEVTFTYDERAASFHDFKHAVMDVGYTVFDDGGVFRIEKERIERDERL